MSNRPLSALDVRLADKRKRIRRAARQLVSEVGFRDTSIAAVAAIAEISTGSVYSYFPSKAALMADVVAVVSQRELDVLRDVAASGAKPGAVLASAIRTFAERAFRNRRLAWSMIAEPADPEVDSIRLSYRRMIAQVFTAILRSGVEAGEFRSIDIEAAAAAIVGSFMEALIGPLAPDRPIDDARSATVAAALADFCLHAVTKQSRHEDHS